MIARIEVALRRARLWWSRSEWAIRLLGLPPAAAPATEPGLTLIQVDGLSHTQLIHALEAGTMPFLRGLTAREGYQLHRQYSGLPSSTPAVQGELFYGVKCGVPAFSFVDHESGRVLRMFEPAAAAQVERRLADQGDPLLRDGSAYFDVYTGGGLESHFCPSSIGWGPFFRALNPIAAGALLLSHAYSFVRTLVLLVVEFALAVVDGISGMIAGEDFLKELKFIPTRVVICILARELITIGTKIDIARGLSVIHVNFVGYDEQAHRRGPTSRFAHWALKGIDDAIARIWRAAHRSTRRAYAVWVYSDHGQEETRPYGQYYGRTIQEAVADVFAHVNAHQPAGHTGQGRGIQSQRIRFVGGARTKKWFPVYDAGAGAPAHSELKVTAMGPIGFVYVADGAIPNQRDRLPRELVTKAHVPLVLAREAPGRVRAWTADGEWALPDDRARLFGAAHPFLDEVAHDLIALCEHPDAGQFVLCGWRAGAPAYSFPSENGAHAGPGPQETEAFALVPRDAPLEMPAGSHLRPLDLRAAALRVLRRAPTPAPAPAGRHPRDPDVLRVMTYNVHSCIGMDGTPTPDRIARVIAEYAPDIVALQELDVGRLRTGGVDQAQAIAAELELEFHFHAALQVAEEQYGNAVLTEWPMRLVKAGPLPGLAGKPGREPRGALWVAVEVRGHVIQFVNTHLGLRPMERWRQAQALLGRDWLGHPDCREPVVLVGDFNALPLSPVCLRMRARLNDAQIALNGHRPRSTWFTRYPVARIDHVFVDPATAVVAVHVPSTALTRAASDHLPLIVDVKLPAT